VKEVRGLAAIAASLRSLGWWLRRDARRRALTLSTGKPEQEPRRLIRLDSWQTGVSDLAKHGVGVRKQILDTLRGEAGSQAATNAVVDVGQRASVSEEDISYFGVDGKVERRQIVAQLGRAVAFVQVYAYGKDLYVGWDAHVNAGSWAAAPVGIGIDRDSGRMARLLGVQSSWYTPNEYDVTDANFLLEWVHTVITRIVKQALREHQIDQEIDFTIVREAREGIAGRKDPDARSGGRRARLRRTA
jgi:hypothetical protein